MLDKTHPQHSAPVQDEAEPERTAPLQHKADTEWTAPLKQRVHLAVSRQPVPQHPGGAAVVGRRRHILLPLRLWPAQELDSCSQVPQGALVRLVPCWRLGWQWGGASWWGAACM